MSRSAYILAIDQGTTSTRSIVFDDACRFVASSQKEFRQFFPQPGWVEHDPEEIWQTVVQTARTAMREAGLAASQIRAIGVTNQRETSVVWEKATGRPIYPAIVWQDRRTASLCRHFASDKRAATLSAKTGLLLDAYFSATKIRWILDTVPGARNQAERGELAFGTIDSWLLWRLSGGRIHATDVTNASRTLLYNIHEECWDQELLEYFGIPIHMVPVVHDCAASFGSTDPVILGAAIPICGVAGDQQAALIGQACFRPGMIKSTYGTGCFVVLNTGNEAVCSHNRLLTTIGYRIAGKTAYALEGSIFVAGAAVQWMRDVMGLIETAADTGRLAMQADINQDVYLVPAFTGLGAPYWDPDARGAIFGLTRATGPAELSRAALESVCYQTRDLLEAMGRDWPAMTETVLRVDGGMTASDYTMQFLADIMAAPVDRPKILETTAMGAAYLAGYHTGLLPAPEEFAHIWQHDKRFLPILDETTRQRKYAGWLDSVRRTLSK